MHTRSAAMTRLEGERERRLGILTLCGAATPREWALGNPSVPFSVKPFHTRGTQSRSFVARRVRFDTFTTSPNRRRHCCPRGHGRSRSPIGNNSERAQRPTPLALTAGVQEDKAAADGRLETTARKRERSRAVSPTVWGSCNRGIAMPRLLVSPYIPSL